MPLHSPNPTVSIKCSIAEWWRSLSSCFAAVHHHTTQSTLLFMVDYHYQDEQQHYFHNTSPSAKHASFATRREDGAEDGSEDGSGQRETPPFWYNPSKSSRLRYCSSLGSEEVVNGDPWVAGVDRWIVSSFSCGTSCVCRFIIYYGTGAVTSQQGIEW